MVRKIRVKWFRGVLWPVLYKKERSKIGFDNLAKFSVVLVVVLCKY